VFDEASKKMQSLPPEHRKTQDPTQLVASISFASTRMCCGLFGNLVEVGSAVDDSKQMGLRSAP